MILKTGKVEAGEVDLAGFGVIKNTEADFDGTEVIDDGTYHLDITFDDGSAEDISIVVSGGGSEPLSDVVDTLNTAVDSAHTGATAAIVNGQIRVTSHTDGADSAILIEDGSGDDGGFMAFLDTIDGVTTEVAQTDGAEGAKQFDLVASDEWIEKPTDDFDFVITIYDSDNKISNPAVKCSYDSTTGYINIQDDADVAEVSEDDKIVVVGDFV